MRKILLSIVAAAMLAGCASVPSSTAPAVPTISPEAVKAMAQNAKILVAGLVGAANIAAATGALPPEVADGIAKANTALPIALDAADKVSAALASGQPVDASVVVTMLTGLIADAATAYVKIGAPLPAVPAS